jgi:hypothetical protein
MRKLAFISLLMLYGVLLSAQDTDKFVFNNTLRDTLSIKFDYTQVGTHYLGSKIANKMHVVEETYTYVEKGTPMSPVDKTIVKKPSIFYAIKKVNKHYKKELKKGNIDTATAINHLNEILDIAYVIYNQNTDSFENYLRSQKKPEDIIQAFAQVELE